MSKLDELINKLCPSGVAFLKIGDVFDTVTDYTASGSFADIAKNVKYKNEEDYSLLLRTTDIKSNFEKGNFIYIDEHAYSYLWRVHLDKESLILPNIGNCGEVYYLKPEMIPYERAALAPNAILVRSSNHNMRYLFHVLQTKQYLNQLAKITSPVGQTKFNKTEFKNLLIPVPPVEVQCEIARILDNFTELTSELTSELTARKKQFEYYKNIMLSFNESEVKFQKISATNKLLRGKRLTTRNLIGDGKYAVYHGGNKPIGYYDKTNRPGDTVMIINVGASAGFVGYSKEDFWSSDGCFCLAHSNEYNNRFLYYYFSTKQDYLVSKVRRAGIPTLDKPIVENILVPVISLPEQERIVEILDIFDSLCFDLSIGLPFEITARLKQYEYYRDKLLTFKELKA